MFRSSNQDCNNHYKWISAQNILQQSLKHQQDKKINMEKNNLNTVEILQTKQTQSILLRQKVNPHSLLLWTHLSSCHQRPDGISQTTFTSINFLLLMKLSTGFFTLWKILQL